MPAQANTRPPLTDQQKRALAYIRKCIKDGLPPTMAELGRGIGLTSNRGAAVHVRALVKKGYLTTLPGKARGFRLIP